MNEAQLDIQQLRIKHILYKSKVRSVAFGGDFDEAFFSATGPLNLWFREVGFTKYPGLSEVRELHQVNAEMTATAEKVNLLYRSGKINDAHAQLAEVERLSEKFQGILTRLEQQFT